MELAPELDSLNNEVMGLTIITHLNSLTQFFDQKIIFDCGFQ